MKHIIHFLLCLICSATNAQSGTLDKSFSNNGKAFYNEFTGDCRAIAIQKDGKIVTGGFHYGIPMEEGFLIMRTDPDGKLDKTFGDNGKVIVSNAEGKDVSFLSGLTIQEDGKIIACGDFTAFNRYFDIGVVRLNPDGTFDSSFNDNGILTTSIGIQDDEVEDIVLQPDGKILITGMKGADSDAGSITAFIVRYLNDGTLDESFGENGVVLTPKSLAISHMRAISLQSDNKIIVGGEYVGKTFFLIRYLTNGMIDSTFDEDRDGVTGIRLEENETPNANMYDIAIQTDDKIVIAGTAGDVNNMMVVIRFNNDGSIDSSFGDKIGYSILSNSGTGIAYHVDISNDKKIILSGQYYTDPGTGFGAARYNVDGSLDLSFGENGVAIAGFNEIDAAGFAGIVQDDGKIIVAGSGYLPDDEIFRRVALVRFNNEVTPAPPEFAKIKKWQGHYGFTWNDWPGNKTTYYSVGRSTNANTFSEIA